MTVRAVTSLLALSLLTAPIPAADADLILHHGKVVTVDPAFSIRQAIAVQGGKILQVGSNDDVLKTRGPRTEVIDLGGKTVLPGLIDSHVHPGGAAMTEFDHPIPDMETVQDVLAYIRSRAKALPVSMPPSRKVLTPTIRSIGPPWHNGSAATLRTACWIASIGPLVATACETAIRTVRAFPSRSLR